MGHLQEAREGRCEESVAGGWASIVNLTVLIWNLDDRTEENPSLYHVGHRLDTEWPNCGDIRISETHMSPPVPDAGKVLPEGQMSTVNYAARRRRASEYHQRRYPSATSYGPE